MDKFDEVIAFCESHCGEHTRIWLAYSGGLDSSLLLHLIANSALKPRLRALHVNHGLSPHAQAWEAHCRAQCAAYEVDFHSQAVDVAVRGGNVESTARGLRYEVFAKFLSAGDLLLSAHHADDQAETLLYRLLRGAGLHGLCAMERTRNFEKGLLLRPLLSWSKAELTQHAESLDLTWIEDESNTDTNFDRNFLRQEIFSLLEQRWPQARKKIAQSAKWLREANSLLDEYALEDLQTCGRQPSRDGESISLEKFRQFSLKRQKHLLRVWCRQRFSYVPQAAQLAQLGGLLNAAADAKPCIKWGNCECRRYQDRLYLVTHREFYVDEDAPMPVHWRSDKDLCLPDNSRLRCETEDASMQKGYEFSVCFRRGGERCKPIERQHSQSLKKLLQEYALEPWLRERAPLVYYEGELIAVGDLFVCESTFVRAHPSLRFTWEWDEAQLPCT